MKFTGLLSTLLPLAICLATSETGKPDHGVKGYRPHEPSGEVQGRSHHSHHSSGHHHHHRRPHPHHSSSTSHSHECHHGSVPEYPLCPQVIPQAQPPLNFINNGWFPFNFGFAGSCANGPIVFNATVDTILHVTDAYCAGDSFNVYDNGVLLFATPDVPIDCSEPAYEPNQANNSPKFSHSYHRLSPGSHYIEIITRNSPNLSGTAFYRVDEIPDFCQVGQYVVVEGTTDQYIYGPDAVCQSFGYLPAVPVPDLAPIGDALFTCLGHNSAALVRTNVPDVPNGSNCLAAFVTDTIESTVINVPTNCYLEYPVLCVIPLLQA